MTAPIVAKARKRATRKRTIPAVNVTAVRPPGMKRATTISVPPRSPSVRSAQPSDRRPRSPPAAKGARLPPPPEPPARREGGGVAAERAGGARGDDERQRQLPGR